MPLNRAPNLPSVDEVYARLIALHEGRSPDDSLRVDARLILALINHIGDPAIAIEAIDLAGSDPRR